MIDSVLNLKDQLGYDMVQVQQVVSSEQTAFPEFNLVNPQGIEILKVTVII